MPFGTRPGTTFAGSASSKTIAADLPPSSSVQRFSCSPQMLAVLAPRDDDVDGPFREPDLCADLAQDVRVERGLRSGLDDGRAARGEGRAELEGEDRKSTRLNS